MMMMMMMMMMMIMMMTMPVGISWKPLGSLLFAVLRFLLGASHTGANSFHKFDFWGGSGRGAPS